MAATLNLYRISFKCRPAPNHPAYWEVQCGVLSFLIYDESMREAQDKAITMFELLPFERVGDQYYCQESHGPTELAILENTRRAGIGIQFFAFETGDEKGFEAMSF